MLGGRRGSREKNRWPLLWLANGDGQFCCTEGGTRQRKHFVLNLIVFDGLSEYFVWTTAHASSRCIVLGFGIKYGPSC